MRGYSVILLLGLILFLGSGCEDQPEFTKPVMLGGAEVQPTVLNAGKEDYTLYCRACHGKDGDGNGPAAKGLQPQPRDFRKGIIKYASVKAPGLPVNADFHRIVIKGLKGTAMLPWDISEKRLDGIIAYIKTFSEDGKSWKAKDAKEGTPLAINADPFSEKQERKAIELGKLIYHGTAECYSCHAAYATKEYIHLSSKKLKGFGKAEFRKGLFEPEAKYSPEYNSVILPREFTYHKIRAGTTKEDLFRSINVGINGPMPAWHGAISENFIWALSYYVRYLSELKPEEVKKLRAELDADEAKAFSTPSAETEAAFDKQFSAYVSSLTVILKLDKVYNDLSDRLSDARDDDEKELVTKLEPMVTKLKTMTERFKVLLFATDGDTLANQLNPLLDEIKQIVSDDEEIPAKLEPILAKLEQLTK